MLRTTLTAFNRSTRLIQKPLSISGTRFYHEKVIKKDCTAKKFLLLSNKPIGY
jgi:hypothetical protein